MELVQHLVNSLGVEEEQAKGGAGLIMQLAKEKLEDHEFDQVAQIIPGVHDLLPQAPEAKSSGGGGLMGALGSLAGGLGGKAGEAVGGDAGNAIANVASAAGLAAGFGKLGMDPSMVSKFMPTILSFVQTKGGGQVVGILSKVL